MITLLAGAIPVSVLVTLLLAALGYVPGVILGATAAIFWTGQVLLVGLRGARVDATAPATQASCVVVSLAGVLLMGGPLSSGGMVLIGLIAPLYALAFPNRRLAWWMLAAYLASVGVGIAIGDGVPWARPLPRATNLALFGLMVTTATVSVFGAFFFFVYQRDLALRLLREAEDKISTLLQSSPGASETIPAWSTSMARDVAGAIGAERIGIWEMRTDGLVPLAAEGLAPPSLDDVHDLSLAPPGTFTQTPQGVLVAVHGTSGEACGALVVSGPSLRWTQTERRLVSGFAHKLGAGLDMNRLRLQVAAADERRALTRQEMHARGIATLQTCPRCGRCYDHTAGACSDDGSALGVPRARFRIDCWTGSASPACSAKGAWASCWLPGTSACSATSRSS